MLLLILEQVSQFAVNYWFANFMPLRMCSAVHYLTGNEVYRIVGRSVRNMAWRPAAALLLLWCVFLYCIWIRNGKHSSM